MSHSNANNSESSRNKQGKGLKGATSTSSSRSSSKTSSLGAKKLNSLQEKDISTPKKLPVLESVRELETNDELSIVALTTPDNVLNKEIDNAATDPWKSASGPYDTPLLNKTAQSIFAGSPPTTNDVFPPFCGYEDEQKLIHIEKIEHDASSVSTHLTGKENDFSFDFQIGSLVWARADDSFPYYPACICPSYFIQLTPKRKKFTVFLYGSDVFDFVLTKNVKDFESNKEAMMNQAELEADMIPFFLHAVSIAEEQSKLDNEARVTSIRVSQNISETLNDNVDVLLQQRPGNATLGTSHLVSEPPTISPAPVSTENDLTNQTDEKAPIENINNSEASENEVILLNDPALISPENQYLMPTANQIQSFQLPGQSLPIISGIDKEIELSASADSYQLRDNIIESEVVENVFEVKHLNEAESLSDQINTASLNVSPTSSNFDAVINGMVNMTIDNELVVKSNHADNDVDLFTISEDSTLLHFENANVLNRAIEQDDFRFISPRTEPDEQIESFSLKNDTESIYREKDFDYDQVFNNSEEVDESINQSMPLLTASFNTKESHAYFNETANNSAISHSNVEESALITQSNDHLFASQDALSQDLENEENSQTRNNLELATSDSFIQETVLSDDVQFQERHDVIESVLNHTEVDSNTSAVFQTEPKYDRIAFPAEIEAVKQIGAVEKDTFSSGKKTVFRRQDLLSDASNLFSNSSDAFSFNASSDWNSIPAPAQETANHFESISISKSEGMPSKSKSFEDASSLFESGAPQSLDLFISPSFIQTDPTFQVEHNKQKFTQPLTSSPEINTFQNDLQRPIVPRFADNSSELFPMNGPGVESSSFLANSQSTTPQAYFPIAPPPSKAPPVPHQSQNLVGLSESTAQKIAPPHLTPSPDPSKVLNPVSKPSTVVLSANASMIPTPHGMVPVSTTSVAPTSVKTNNDSSKPPANAPAQKISLSSFPPTAPSILGPPTSSSVHRDLNSKSNSDTSKFIGSASVPNISKQDLNPTTSSTHQAPPLVPAIFTPKISTPSANANGPVVSLGPSPVPIIAVPQPFSPPKSTLNVSSSSRPPNSKQHENFMNGPPSSAIPGPPIGGPSIKNFQSGPPLTSNASNISSISLANGPPQIPYPASTTSNYYPNIPSTKVPHSLPMVPNSTQSGPLPSQYHLQSTPVNANQPPISFDAPSNVLNYPVGNQPNLNNLPLSYSVSQGSGHTDMQAPFLIPPANGNIIKSQIVSETFTASLPTIDSGINAPTPVSSIDRSPNLVPASSSAPPTIPGVIPAKQNPQKNLQIHSSNEHLKEQNNIEPVTSTKPIVASTAPPAVPGVYQSTGKLMSTNSAPPAVVIPPKSKPMQTTPPSAPGTNFQSKESKSITKTSPYSVGPSFETKSQPMSGDALPQQTLPPTIPTKERGISGQSYSGRSFYPSRGCPVVNFGFGGMIAVMIPQMTQPLRPLISGPVLIFKQADLIKNSITASESEVPENKSQSNSYHTISKDYSEELKCYFNLVESFPGSLLAKTKTATNEPAIRAFIAERKEYPTSTRLSESFFNKVNCCSRSTLVSSERTLWSLLELLISTKGSVCCSDVSFISSPHSPESKIIKLVLGVGTDANDLPSLAPLVSSVSSKAPFLSFYDELGNEEQTLPSSTPEILLQIENFLILGLREEAIEFAIQNKMWPIAMMISSICGAQTYQRVIQRFLACNIPRGTPLHTLSLIYSNQTGSVREAESLTPSNQNKEVTFMPSQWRRILAAFLTNKGHDWELAGRILGEKVLLDDKDVMAAHILYICSRCLPSLQSLNRKDGVVDGQSSKTTPVNARPRYSLLGSTDDCTNCALIDCNSISALRMTEILEWCLDLGAKNNSLDSSGSLIGGLSGLFGFSSSSKESVQEKKESDGKNIYAYISSEQILHVKSVLAISKFKFALLLADLGYTSKALSYAQTIKDIASTLELFAASNKSQKQGQPEYKGPRQFKKKFIQDLDEFIDRLQVFDGIKSYKPVGFSNPSVNQTTSGKNIPSTSSNNSDHPSKWGIGSFVNALSSSTLKDLVDGSSEPQSSSLYSNQSSGYPAVNIPPKSAQGSNIQSSNNQTSTNPTSTITMQNKGPPMPSNITPMQSNTPPMPMNISSVPSTIQQKQTTIPVTSNALSNNPNTVNAIPSSNSYPPFQVPTNMIPSQRTSVPSFPSMQPQTNEKPVGSGFSNSNISSSSTGQPFNSWPLSQANDSNHRAHTNSENSVPSSSHSNNKIQSPSDQSSTTNQFMSFSNPTNPNPNPTNGKNQGSNQNTGFSPPGYQNNSSVTDQKPQSDKTPSSPNTNSTTPTKKSSDPAKGKPENPQPQQTGIFGKLKKNLISWMHPEAHSADENLGDGLNAYFDKSTGRWVFPGEEAKEDPALAPPPTTSAVKPAPEPKNSSQASNGSEYDPLASLMAPPPRSISSSVNSANDDPMAALMAPPMRKVGPPQNLSGPKVGGSPPPSFNMWKPAVTPTSTQEPQQENSTMQSSLIRADHHRVSNDFSSWKPQSTQHISQPITNEEFEHGNTSNPQNHQLNLSESYSQPGNNVTNNQQPQYFVQSQYQSNSVSFQSHSQAKEYSEHDQRSKSSLHSTHPEFYGDANSNAYFSQGPQYNEYTPFHQQTQNSAFSIASESAPNSQQNFAEEQLGPSAILKNEPSESSSHQPQSQPITHQITSFPPAFDQDFAIERYNSFESVQSNSYLESRSYSVNAFNPSVRTSSNELEDVGMNLDNTQSEEDLSTISLN